MIEMTATVVNPQGIHCRPSTEIMKAVIGYNGEINISSENGNITLTSVMDLIGLGLLQEDKVKISVSGPDEERVCKKLVELHGGKIWGESEGVGKGSTFSFIIPDRVPF